MRKTTRYSYSNHFSTINNNIMPTNFYMYFIAALIPLLVGTVYYHPKVFGNAWMKSNGFTEESLAGGNMPAILALAYFLGLLMCTEVSQKIKC